MDPNLLGPIAAGVVFVGVGWSLHKGPPPQVQSTPARKFVYHFFALSAVAAGLVMLGIVALRVLGAGR